jgi:hypothetical protein
MTVRAPTANRSDSIARQSQRDNLKKLARKKRPSASMMGTVKADRTEFSRAVRR